LTHIKRFIHQVAVIILQTFKKVINGVRSSSRSSFFREQRF